MPMGLLALCPQEISSLIPENSLTVPTPPAPPMVSFSSIVQHIVISQAVTQHLLSATIVAPVLYLFFPIKIQAAWF